MNESIAKGFDFLEKTWQQNQGFWSGFTTKEHFEQNSNFAHYYGPKSMRELWTPWIILDLLLETQLRKDIKESLIDLVKGNFSKQALSNSFEFPSPLPDDVDATAICCLVCLRAKVIDIDLAKMACEQILGNINKMGIVKVWFSSLPPFVNVVDTVISANALFLSYHLNKQALAKKTEEYLLEILEKDDYKSCYYSTEEAFLYILSRIANFSEDFRKKVIDRLTVRLKSKMGLKNGPIAISQRILAAKNCHLQNEVDQEILLELQRLDGSWPEDLLFEHTDIYNQIYIHGSKEVSTAFALKALDK